MFALPSPTHKIEHPLLEKHDVSLHIKRDDLIHPVISGNKWRKLKYNLEFAIENEFKKTVTLGGAYSNHILATAAACKDFGLESIGIIRGDELTKESNPTLKTASEFGMRFKFVERRLYKEIRSHNSTWIEDHFGNHYFIPEGGTNDLAIRGTSEILSEIDFSFDSVISAFGTGGTLVGLIKSADPNQKVVGISSLKGNSLKSELDELLKRENIIDTNVELNLDYHFGGYGKTTDELISFINWANNEFGIIFDPIYTGKAFFGVWDMIGNGYFDHQTLVFLHTGGLQGIAGFNQKSTQKIHY